MCRFLPPIVAQKTRNFFINTKDAEKLNLNFKRKTFTGSYFEGNTSDFHAFKLSVHGYFEWRNVLIANEALRKKTGHIVEVGANIGTETISFCDIAKKYNCSVIAFEPVPSNFEIIIHNQKLNQIDNLILHPCLVAEQEGKAYFNFPSGNNSGSGFIDRQQKETNGREYDVVTLDNTVNGEEVSFMSIDVEGFEYQVLLGARQILSQSKPVFILEVNKKYLKTRGNTSVNELYKFLESMHYNCYYINTFGLEKVEGVNFLDKSNKNWLCIHSDSKVNEKELNRKLISFLFGFGKAC
ncbi:MAG: FkbM family methyltransferase [Flavobacteriaceae bacterium]|nr:FkbM family methyltransferase [Flavobacteriaceae bacterium]